MQKETGWTHDYLLWGESWFNLQLKLADMPHSEREQDTIKEIEDDQELVEFLTT